jgi:hypothetical protein
MQQRLVERAGSGQRGGAGAGAGCGRGAMLTRLPCLHRRHRPQLHRQLPSSTISSRPTPPVAWTAHQAGRSPALQQHRPRRRRQRRARLPRRRPLQRQRAPLPRPAAPPPAKPAVETRALMRRCWRGLMGRSSALRRPGPGRGRREQRRQLLRPLLSPLRLVRVTSSRRQRLSWQAAHRLHPSASAARQSSRCRAWRLPRPTPPRQRQLARAAAGRAAWPTQPSRSTCGRHWTP